MVFHVYLDLLCTGIVTMSTITLLIKSHPELGSFGVCASPMKLTLTRHKKRRVLAILLQAVCNSVKSMGKNDLFPLLSVDQIQFLHVAPCTVRPLWQKVCYIIKQQLFPYNSVCGVQLLKTGLRGKCAWTKCRIPTCVKNESFTCTFTVVINTATPE